MVTKNPIIVPAVLSDNLDNYTKAYRLFEKMEGNKKVHIDIMDGMFVDSESPKLESILKIETKLDKQVHLMEEDPIESIELCEKFGVKEVMLHIESSFDRFEELKNFKNIKFYLVFNPEIEIENGENFLEYFHGVLLMTVHPGMQGAKFVPEALKKVSYLHKIGFEGEIIIDGSVNKDTLGEILKYDVDQLIVGAGIIKQADPILAYNELKDLILTRVK